MIELIIKFIVPLLCTILTVYIIPILKKKNLYAYVKIAVEAAEQIFEHGKNTEKFQYVKNWIQKKFKITDEDLKNIIESAVYELKNSNK